MRKLTALLLTMMLALCLTACAGNDTKKLAGTWTYSADITSRMNEEIKAALELDESVARMRPQLISPDLHRGADRAPYYALPWTRTPSRRIRAAYMEAAEAGADGGAVQPGGGGRLHP